MAIQSISFQTSPTKDGMGMPLYANGNVPKMRPRKKASLKQLITSLEKSLEELAEVECTFWACKGPTRPRHMVTCNKCWAMREIAAVIASLKLRA